jgi:Ni2+-binding GTPase involved in maturation of urease and hydrogenase
MREDASMNFDTLDELSKRHPDLEIVFLESGGDNRAARFSPELVDASIYVIDVPGDGGHAIGEPATRDRGRRDGLHHGQVE